MSDSPEKIRSLDDLRSYVHRVLCGRENLLLEQFAIFETRLTRGGKHCGHEFFVQGPRSVRLTAIWAADHNTVYFYDASGARFLKTRLPHRLSPAAELLGCV